MAGPTRITELIDIGKQDEAHEVLRAVLVGPRRTRHFGPLVTEVTKSYLDLSSKLLRPRHAKDSLFQFSKLTQNSSPEALVEVLCVSRVLRAYFPCFPTHLRAWVQRRRAGGHGRARNSRNLPARLPRWKVPQYAHAKSGRDLTPLSARCVECSPWSAARG